MTTLRAVGLLLFIAGVAVPASSQNLLQNGTFDAGVSPWFNGTFSTLDALGSPSSGSIQGSNAATTPFTYASLVSDCTPVVGGMTYAGRYDYRLTVTAGVVTASATLGPAWYSSPGCSGFLTNPSGPDGTLADGAWHHGTDYSWIAPAAAQSANVRLNITKIDAGGSATANFDNVAFTLSGTCAPLPDVLCLNNGRFQVEADWTTSTSSGRARTVPLTGDTGYLWFFSDQNVEAVIKVLNACSLNSRYWVFAGGLTNQGVTITVTDTKSGTVKTYSNTRGTAFAPIQDTSAFATCP